MQMGLTLTFFGLERKIWANEKGQFVHFLNRPFQSIDLWKRSFVGANQECKKYFLAYSKWLSLVVGTVCVWIMVHGTNGLTHIGECALVPWIHWLVPPYGDSGSTVPWMVVGWLTDLPGPWTTWHMSPHWPTTTGLTTRLAVKVLMSQLS